MARVCRFVFLSIALSCGVAEPGRGQGFDRGAERLDDAMPASGWRASSGSLVPLAVTPSPTPVADELVRRHPIEPTWAQRREERPRWLLPVIGGVVGAGVGLVVGLDRCEDGPDPAVCIPIAQIGIGAAIGSLAGVLIDAALRR